MLGVVTSTTAFTNRVFEVNPGLDCTFPWASKVAPGFQQWKLDAMFVEFKSMLPSATASFQSFGNVCLAAALDPSLPTFADASQISMAKFAVCRKPNESFKAPVECGDFANAKYFIRTGSVPATGTLSAYDPCNIQVVTYGQPSDGVQIGNLWIHYRIRLFNPVMRGFGEFCQGAHYTIASPTDAAPFAGEPTSKFDTIGVTFPTTTSLSLVSGSKGRWMITLFYKGSSQPTATALPTLTYTSNCAAATTFTFSEGSNTMVMAPGVGLNVNLGRVMYTIVIDVLQNSLPAVLTFAFSAGSLPTSSPVGDVIISQLSDLAI
jgi:hypothetical protein